MGSITSKRGRGEAAVRGRGAGGQTHSPERDQPLGVAGSHQWIRHSLSGQAHKRARGTKVGSTTPRPLESRWSGRCEWPTPFTGPSGRGAAPEFIRLSKSRENNVHGHGERRYS